MLLGPSLNPFGHVHHTMLIPILISIFLLLTTLFLQSRRPNPPKIFNVYSQPGKWYHIKFLTFFLLLWIRRLKSKLRKPTPVHELEKMKPLSDHEKAFDATFFQAVSQNGFYLCGGIERRHQAKANGLFYVVVPELGLLESEKLPNTLLESDPASVLLLKEYSAEGISLTPVSPMKKWKVGFKGKMRVQREPNRLVNVKLNGEWSSNLPYFLFERDMNLKALAKAIAREPWDERLFKALKDAHQTHYEQMGYFHGTLQVENTTYTLKMDAFRDHSFGYKRDWSLMHRYIFHMFYLKDGTRVSFGVVSQPCTTSILEMGYIILPNKSINSIESCDLLLYQHGEKGIPSTNYAFSFKANNDIYDVKVKVIHESVHYKGNNIEARLFERFIECEVNGISGKGISEWHYNNLKNIY